MPHIDPFGGSIATTHRTIHALREFLRASGGTVDERWREWAREFVNGHELSPQSIARIWKEVLDFDQTLAEYVAQPVPLDVRAVVVAGSGKETFKTFNVSTAASILAAASGANVVKGVSHSVSTVSGSADTLNALGLPVCEAPSAVQWALESDRIAFISYSAFCPTYANRYDSVFPFLNPFSFFMPVAVLGVQASSFVYGIAHPNVSLAAEAIGTVRPDLRRGIVVATDLSQQEMIDERVDYGINYAAVLDGTQLQLIERVLPAAPRSWRAAVGHRRNHQDNAGSLTSSLAPDGCQPCAEMVDRNAALILAASQWGTLEEVDAMAFVREVRLSGGGLRLLAELRDGKGPNRAV